MKLKDVFEGVGARVEFKKDTRIVVINKIDELFRIVDENESVLDHFNDATADAFGSENKENGHDGVREHVLNVNSIAVCYDEDTVLGFASIRKLSELNVFYVHGIAIRTGLQGSGAGETMIRELLLSNPGFRYISLTTQNPSVYRLIEKYCQDIYPAPNYQTIPVELRGVATSLMRNRSGEFDSRRFVSHGLYSKCLYGKGIPMSKDDEINSWFEKSLNIVNGISNDGFLFLGRISQ